MTPKHAASLAAAFLVGAGATVSLGQGAHAAPPPPNPEVLHWLGVFGDVLDTAEREHIEPVDSPKAIQAALEGLMQSLDPHSSYITPEEFAALIGKGPASASVGLNLSNDRQGAVIVSVLPNSPASRGDVQRGDHILAIDGTSAADTLDRVVHRLRGPVGSPITLTLGRGDRQVTVTLIRDHVAAAPAVTSRMIGTQGYVSVVRLDDKTADEVAKAIRTFKAAQPAMTGLVLDLRDCPGGLFGEAVGISDIFLEGGVIVSQRGRDPKDVERYMAHMGDELRGAPMAVLVNGTTASGCEIIAGALQDRGRARVVGMPTFGLGAIQTVIPVHGGKDG
ncbi:S41 family peptidase, partial [Phenylobacterium sp.]|uniref:S41 family peptidase n=1 Tax=Phenylobacterium sp. TaxID=1871053 RepID=UPI002F3E9A7F